MNFTGKKLYKPAALAALLVSLTLASPAWLSAATYSVGEGGDYATLKEIVDSGIIQSGDEIVLLGNDASLNGGDYADNYSGPDGMGLSGVTISGQEGTYTVISQRESDPDYGKGIFYFGWLDNRYDPEISFNNIAFQGGEYGGISLINGASSLKVSGSNLLFQNTDIARLISSDGETTLSNVSNISFIGNQKSSFLIAGAWSASIVGGDNIVFRDNTGSLLSGMSVGLTNINNLLVEGNYGSINGHEYTGLNNLTNARFINNFADVVSGTDVRVRGGDNIVFEGNLGRAIRSGSTMDWYTVTMTDVGSISFLNNTVTDSLSSGGNKGGAVFS